MQFSEVIGQNYIKKHLEQTADKARVAHAQLFVGAEGVGTLAMALAYAEYLLCLGSEDIELCKKQCKELVHPDLHFVFPVAKTDSVKEALSDNFLKQWREFILNNPYANLFQWLQYIEVEKKQGAILVKEANSIVHKLNLRAFGGGYKVMIIWMAEKMNADLSNKLLKLIEEPPRNSILLLIAENEGQILDTVRSRCQIIQFPNLSQDDISKTLVRNFEIEESSANKIAFQSNGNYNFALNLIENSDNNEFEDWFVVWVRAAFRAKGNASVIQDLVNWSNTIAAIGREKQRSFLKYCIDFFRQALLFNYGAKELVYLEVKTPGFHFEKFAPFIHGNNILLITKELENAIFHIERNANAKMVFLDTSIKLTRFLHQKEN